MMFFNRMKPIYSSHFLNALAKDGVIVAKSTQIAHQNAFESNPTSIKPAKKKETTPASNSLFHFKTIGPAVPVKTLGKGQYGKVKKVINTEGNIYALKTSLYENKSDKNYKCYEREIEALRVMGRLIETGVRGYKGYYKVFILTEFFDGMNGFDYKQSRINENSLMSLDTALKIFSSMVSEVESMHNAGLRHHDIKPDNFIILKNDQTKIVDFGFSDSFGLFEEDIHALGIAFGDFLSITEYNHSDENRILDKLSDEMTSNEPWNRPSLIKIANVLTMVQFMLTSVPLNNLDDENLFNLLLLTTEYKANNQAITLVDHIYHLYGIDGLDINDGAILKTALKNSNWKIAAHLISKDVSISFYKRWHLLAERTANDHLRTLFGGNVGNPTMILRIYAIAVKQKIESLPADPRMAENRNTTCQTLDAIIHHPKNGEAVDKARAIVQAITTCQLQGRSRQRTAWASISTSLQRDYPSTVQTSTRFMTLFSSCFKRRSNDVIPVQVQYKPT